MSIKTIRKRIAVVAVSALTAGLFSVVSAPVANAAVPTTGLTFIEGTASTTGSGFSTGSDQTTMGSVGFITRTNSVGTAADGGFTVGSGGVLTASVYPSAQIAFAASSSTTNLDSLGITVSGGTISNFICTNAGTASINGTSTVAACAQASTTMSSAGLVVNAPSTPGAVVTVSFFKGTGITGTTTATNGALLATHVLTVSATSAVQVYSASKSVIAVQAQIAKGATPSGTTAYDDTSVIQNGSVGVIYVALKDALSSALLAASNTSLTATTSAGTIIGHATAASANSYAATGALTVITLDNSGVYYIVVNQPVANTAGTATVNISLDGAVIATKTLKWVGDISTLEVLKTSNTTFVNGATATVPAAAIGGIQYVAKDAAGNAVTLAAQPTVDSATGSMVGATVYSGNTLASGGSYQTSAAGYGLTSMVIPATVLNGAGTYRLKLTNAAGTSIYSATQNVVVSNGGPDSFTASWDKASYAPGDIAVLTIKVLDAYKNPVGAGTLLPGLTAGLIVSTSGFTAVGGTCVDASYTDSAGVKTCKFAAGNTEGSYSWNVDLDTATPQSALVGSLKIAPTTAVVSNADVLKSIVALIASINKQIQALQKLILKR